MTRIIMNDIKISRKSIRQIPISKERNGRIFEKKNNQTDEPEIIRVKKSPNWQRKPLNPRFVIWLIAIICLLSLFFGISIIFSSAKIIITPKTEKILFTDDLYTAKLNSLNAQDLSFEVLKVSQTASETVDATEEKEVNQKASGIIIIYNNYSTVSQRLINNTRFEANNGKVYRINSSVVVPGYKKVDGKIIPGSIEATVYADQAGEEYNLKLADLEGDFKIPGFKGDPRYEGFYARLKEDIIGGYIGKQWIIADTLRSSAQDSLKIKLKEQLLKELYAVKPENYLIFNDSYSVNYINLSDSSLDNNQVKINMQGDLNAVVFNNLKLAKYIAEKKISDFDGLPTEFVPSDNLVTTFKAKDSTDLWKNSVIEVKLSGEAIIKWLNDYEALKKDFAGKKETDFENLVMKYKNSIDKIEVIFSPVWTRYIPDNLDKIIIQEQI